MSDETSAVVVTGAADGTLQDVIAGEHHLKADHSVAAGGSDEGPDPYALLLAALGTCTSMTLGMYARRKQFPLERVTVYLRHAKVHAQDCDDCETKDGMIDRIERKIEMQGPLNDEQRKALLAIADKCPVHRTLTNEIKIDTQEIGKPSA